VDIGGADIGGRTVRLEDEGVDKAGKGEEVD
jgi:hypothetical protein